MIWSRKQVFGSAWEHSRTTLEVADYEDGEVTITIDPEHGGQSALIALDKERARELFNWLGVWLHRS